MYLYEFQNRFPKKRLHNLRNCFGSQHNSLPSPQGGHFLKERSKEKKLQRKEKEKKVIKKIQYPKSKSGKTHKRPPVGVWGVWGTKEYIWGTIGE